MNSRRLTLLTTAGLCAFVAGGYIFLLPLYLDNQVEHYLATLPQTQADQIDTNTLAGTVTLGNLNSFAGGNPVNVSSLVVHVSPLGLLYASLTGGRITADVTLENLTGAIGANNFSIPSARISQARFDAPADGSTSAMIQAFSAAGVEVPQITYRGDTSNSSVSALSLTSVNHGRAAQFTAASIRTSRTVTNAITVTSTVQMQDLVMTNLNFAAYDNLYFTSGPASAPLVRIYDSEQLANMSLTMTSAAMSGNFSADQISAGAFYARPFATPLGSLSQNPAAIRSQGPALFRDFLTGFHFTSTDMHDFTMTFDLPKLGHVTSTMSHLSMHEFGAGQLQDFRIEDLTVSNPQFNFKLANFDIGRLDFNPLLTAMASPAGLNVTQVLKAMPTVGHFQLAGINIGLPGQPSLASLANFTVDNSDYRNGVPSQASYSLDHLDLPVMALGKASPFLAKLGYSQFNVSSHANLNFNRDTGDLTLQNADFTLDGGFHIALSAALHGVSTPPYSAATPNNASFTNTQINFQNLGIVDRYFAPQIAKLGRDKAIAAELTQDNQSITAQFGQTALAKQLIAANAQFIQNPHSISIRMNSPTPIPLTNWKSAPWQVSANQ